MKILWETVALVLGEDEGESQYRWSEHMNFAVSQECVSLSP